jgi:hypothetical protein
MKYRMLRHWSGVPFPVQVMATSGNWAMVRRKRAEPFCVRTKELEVNATTGEGSVKK